MALPWSGFKGKVCFSPPSSPAEAVLICSRAVCSCDTVKRAWLLSKLTDGLLAPIKLHNPHKLMVQEIQIDIVNADETIATDLQAITYVALHVR